MQRWSSAVALVALVGCEAGGARGIQVSEVTATSGAGITIYADGAPTGRSMREGPIVRGRDTYFLVHVEVEPGWEPREIEAALTITVGGERFVDRQVRTIRASTAAWAADPTGGARYDLHASDFEGFVFGVDAAYVQPDLGWQVALREVHAGAGGAAPRSSPVPARVGAVGVEPDFVRYQLEIAPYRYDYRGCTQRTQTSDAQLQPMLDRLYAWFPVQDIEWSVLDRPIRYEQPIVDFDAIFAAVASRVERGVGPDTYTLAMVQGCSPSDLVSGLFGRTGSIPNSLPHAGQSPFLLSYMYRSHGTSDEPFDYEVDTFVHEQAHALGRTHVDCGGAGGNDRRYPFPDGQIGTWGIDIVTGRLHHPELAHDFMSYCESNFVSPYTWASLFRRLADHTLRIDTSALERGADDVEWLLGMVGPGREGSWRRVSGPSVAHDGASIDVVVEGPSGVRTVLPGISHPIPYSEHAFVIAPFPAPLATAAEVLVDGVVYQIPLTELRR